jgi:PEP-CTERM motif
MSWAATSANAQNVTLFTTADDFTGWGTGSATPAPSTAYDFDGSTTNGAGNYTTGTGTAGSLQLTTATPGYGNLANLPGEAGNSAFMSAIDPGSVAAYSAASGYGPGSTVAYSGSLQVTFTAPAHSSGTYFQIGMLIQYDGGYNQDFSSSTVNDGTVDGLSTITATIPYSFGAGSFNYLNMSLMSNTDYAITAPFYIDQIQVVHPVVFSAVPANWIQNGSGTWESSANWNPSAPGLAGSTATFDSDGGAITAANPTVTLSSAITLDSLNFNTSASSYTIINGGGGSITLDGSTNQVNVLAGNHTINTPLVMGSNTVFTISPSSSLTLANVTGGGYSSVTVTGGGTLIENQIATTGVVLVVNGTTLTTLSASTPAQELYYFNIYNSAVLNLNGTLIVDGGNFDSSATINLGATGHLQTQGTGTENVNSTITGSGSFDLGGGPNGGATTATFNGTNSSFSGPISVNNGSTIIAGTDANLGNGSATNTITLNNGTLQATAALTGTHALIAASGNGTLNTGGFNVGLGSISGAGTLTVAGGGGVVTVAPQAAGGGVRTLALGGLNISAGNSVSFGTAAAHSDRTVLVTSTLSNAGNIDLGGNDLIVHSGTLSTINAEVAAGFNAPSGYWNGTTGGSISSLAAAGDSTYLTALGVIPVTVTGTLGTDAVTAGDVLVKYTYYGDATGDGHVDGTDYSIIDANNGLTSGALWSQGDFNYDGKVDGSDYSLIDNTFNMQSSAGYAAQIATSTSEIAASTSVGTAVPEPTTVGLLGIAAIGLLSRRRHRAVTNKHGVAARLTSMSSVESSSPKSEATPPQ